jgi:hypothetical protein
MPGVMGAGDETAKQAGHKVSGDLMILVSGEATAS